MIPTDEQLVLYAEGKLSPEEEQRLLTGVESDAELAETLGYLRASRLPIAEAFQEQKLPPMPEDLQQRVSEMAGTQSNNFSEPQATSTQAKSARPLYKFAQAACVLLVISGAYYAGWQQSTNQNAKRADLHNSLTQQTLPDAEVTALQQWVNRVADYQTLYVPATVANLTVDHDATELMLSKIEDDSTLQTAIPDLTSEGYRFIRAQELGYEGETLVQLVYLKEGRAPLALCFMPASNLEDRESVVSERHGLGTVSWVLNEQQYVIVADEPVDALKSLYRSASTQFTRT